MGKNRDKQRTKGNLKPSSSGRAAALVTRDGTLGFVGFDGQGSSNLGYVPMTTSLGDDVDSTVDGSFRMVMRKLTKRDSLTKYKALQEFSELCKSSKAEVLEGILPFWPRLYNKLAMDIDQRVREATQEAMFQLVQKVGRNLAPYLKTLIGAWLCAQFDSYAPVASAAQRAFQSAFSGSKQNEALMFCKVGLCEFLEDNILRQTADSLSDPKVISKEDRESKYNRVLSSSLLALGFLMTAYTNDINQEMQSRYQELFDDKKLWKLARHSSPLVRSAFFSLVISSCMRIPTVVQSVSTQACPVVMSSLDETEPAVSHNLWGAVLFVLKTIPDCWSYVNTRKAVLPKLWSLLKHGGHGCASVVFPSLLPFISTLPQEIVGSGVGFYQNFFNNLLDGLQLVKVQQSPSESMVVMATYMECLRYCLVHSSSQENDWSVKGYLVKEQLIPLMKSSLQPISKLPRTHLYEGVSNLLKFLNKNIAMETRPKKDEIVAMETGSQGVTMETISKRVKEEALSVNDLVVEEAETILDWFWCGLRDIIMETITPCEELKVDSKTVDNISTCIIGLNSPSSLQTKKKLHKVVFVDPDVTSNLSTPCSSTTTDNLECEQLLDIVINISQLCLKQNNSPVHLKLFASLLPHFICEKFLQVLLKKTKENLSLVELCDELLNSVVYGLLEEFREDRDNLAYILSILLGVLKCYDLDLQIEKLNHLFEVNNSTDFLYNLLSKAISQSIPGMLSWLASQSSSERIQKLLRASRYRDSDVNEESFWEILQICIANQKTGPLVSLSCVDIIMERIVEVLRTNTNKSLTKVLGVLDGYFVWGSKNCQDLSSSTEDILLLLFLLQVGQPDVENQDVRDVWMSGLKALSADHSRYNVVLVRTAAIVSEQLRTAQSIDSIVNLSESATYLLQVVHDISAQDGLSTLYVNKIYYNLIPNSSKCTEWRETSDKYTWLGSLLTYSMPIMSQTQDTRTVANTLDTHHKTVSLAVLITKALLTDKEGSMADKVSDDVLIQLYLEATWVHVWCLCVLGGRDLSGTKYSSTLIQLSPQIHNLSNLLSRTLTQLFNIIQERQLAGSLFTDCIKISQANGWLWTLVLQNVINQLTMQGCDLDLSNVLVEMYGKVFNNETNQIAQAMDETEATLQSLACILPYMEAIYDVKVITENCSKYLCQNLSPQEFCCIFPLLSSSMSTWCKLANQSEEAKLEYQLTVIEILDKLLEWKNKHDRILLINASMDDVTSPELTINLCVLDIIALAVQCTPSMLTSCHWDFILCSLAGWIQTCEENLSTNYTCLFTNRLTFKTFKVLCCVSKYFQDLSLQSNQQSTQQDDNEENNIPTQTSLLSEWQEFFSGNLYNNVLSMFLQAAVMSSNYTCLPFTSTCESLGLALTFVPISVLENYEFTHVQTGDSSLPQWAQDILHHFLPLLNSSLHSLRIGAYILLSRVMPKIASCHTHQQQTVQDQNEDQRSPPLQLMIVINKVLDNIQSMIHDAEVPFGTRLCLATDNELLTLVVELFMSFRLLIVFFQHTTMQSRPQYASYLKKNKLIDNLMSVLFCIIPLDSPTKVTEDFELSITDDVIEDVAHGLGASLYYSVLHWMPAVARQWFNRLEKKHATLIDKYTSSYVTPLLCQHEMSLIRNSSVQFSNMQVKARPVAGEVAAVYSIDDLSMELVVKLANNHPLGVVTVDSGKKVGVTTSQWRSWILQMTTFLTHQNGSIMDGLVLWKQNADKHFEGVDDCMICFSVIHASNYSLPKLTCRTCKKKFHSICLYRWFNTSNNSTCPLCRNIF